MSDLIGNSEDSFSHNAAHLVYRESLMSFSCYEPRHEKTNVLVSDLVQQKPGCSATEDG